MRDPAEEEGQGQYVDKAEMDNKINSEYWSDKTPSNIPGEGGGTPTVAPGGGGLSLTAETGVSEEVGMATAAPTNEPSGPAAPVAGADPTLGSDKIEEDPWWHPMPPTAELAEPAAMGDSAADSPVGGAPLPDLDTSFGGTDPILGSDVAQPMESLSSSARDLAMAGKSSPHLGAEVDVAQAVDAGPVTETVANQAEYEPHIEELVEAPQADIEVAAPTLAADEPILATVEMPANLSAIGATEEPETGATAGPALASDGPAVGDGSDGEPIGPQEG